MRTGRDSLRYRVEWQQQPNNGASYVSKGACTLSRQIHVIISAPCARGLPSTPFDTFVPVHQELPSSLFPAYTC